VYRLGGCSRNQPHSGSIAKEVSTSPSFNNDNEIGSQ
jgi:hypothetical protein